MLTSASSLSAKARGSGSFLLSWPESVPQVAKPRATGTGVSRRASRSGARPVMSTPFDPPPPYCTALPFQSAGRLTSKLIGGAFGSNGATAPSTLQYSRVTPGLSGSAGTVAICAEVIVAPPLGSPISLAMSFRLAKSAQLPAALTGDATATIRIVTVLPTSAVFNVSMGPPLNVLYLGTSFGAQQGFAAVKL